MTPLALARLCRDAYERTPTWSTGDVEARCTVEDGLVVIAFRGTTFDGWDMIWDLRSYPWRAPELGTRVHAGFLKAVRPLWKEQESEFLKHNDSTVLTGHSKGGAEATVLAALMARTGRPPRALVTFGSPRVGFSGLGRVLADVPVLRFVNGSDAVARVPLPAPFPYRHVGGRLPLGRGMRPFRDHRIDAYVRALEVRTESLEALTEAA